MKNIVITGSTRGIGFSMTIEFLRAGCNVTLSSRGEAIAASIRKELSPFEGKYIYVSCDVQEKANLQKNLGHFFGTMGWDRYMDQ